MNNIIDLLLVANAIIVILLVIINQPQTDSTFGGKSSFTRTRRGLEKNIHFLTIAFSATLVILSIVNHIY